MPDIADYGFGDTLPESAVWDAARQTFGLVVDRAGRADSPYSLKVRILFSGVVFFEAISGGVTDITEDEVNTFLERTPDELLGPRLVNWQGHPAIQIEPNGVEGVAIILGQGGPPSLRAFSIYTWDYTWHIVCKGVSVEELAWEEVPRREP